MTINQIIQYIEETFRMFITKGWVNSFLYWHRDALSKTFLKPQEDLRLKIPRVYLTKYLDLVEKIIQITNAELIYNIDEPGLSDWENRKPKTVILPKELENDELHYPINRSLRHITLVVTVSAGGDAYFPLVVTSDSSLEHNFNLGIRRDVDLNLHAGGSSYISKEVFNSHIINKIIPQVDADRESSNSSNCSSHLDEDLLRILAQHNIIVITYPPHTSHVYQILDLLLFGV